MKAVQIRELKAGDKFYLSPNSKRFWTRGKYLRCIREYEVHPDEDQYLCYRIDGKDIVYIDK